MRHFHKPLLVLLAAVFLAGAAPVTFPKVEPRPTFTFPRDHGAHPAFRTEWWYVTGWLKTQDGRDLGVQVTFFRSRTGLGAENPSRFAPQQILFAHAALSDPAIGHLVHDQRISRQGFGLAEAAMTDTAIVLDDWSLNREASGTFKTRVRSSDFDLDLTLDPTQPVLRQGLAGYSQKGPKPEQASYYFTLPHLRVTGTITQGGKRVPVTGEAWLDREWSSTLLDPRAVGWDWVGLNLDDGSALTAFQVRDKSGAPVWAGGSLRTSTGQTTVLGPGDVAFATRRTWHSPRTGTDYPVERSLTIKTPGGPRQWTLKPLMADSELDSRRGGGPVYWEGAVRTEGGRGFLELTGYLTPLSL